MGNFVRYKGNDGSYSGHISRQQKSRADTLLPAVKSSLTVASTEKDSGQACGDACLPAGQVPCFTRRLLEPAGCIIHHINLYRKTKPVHPWQKCTGRPVYYKEVLMKACDHASKNGK